MSRNVDKILQLVQNIPSIKGVGEILKDVRQIPQIKKILTGGEDIYRLLFLGEVKGGFFGRIFSKNLKVVALPTVIVGRGIIIRGLGGWVGNFSKNWKLRGCNKWGGSRNLSENE